MLRDPIVILSDIPLTFKRKWDLKRRRIRRRNRRIRITILILIAVAVVMACIRFL